MSVDCRSDRVSYARRGQLSSSEALVFDAHLQVCESCRLNLEIGADFDALGVPSWDDGARIERLAARVVARQRQPRRRRATRAALLAACVLLFAGVAAAAALRWFGPCKPAVGAAPDAAVHHSLEGRDKSLPSTLASAAVASASAQPLAGIDSAPLNVSARPDAQGFRLDAPPPSAAQLFHNANAARLAGQAQHAIRSYRALQRDYPGSPEAGLSLVSLGSMLTSGSPSTALEQFDRYLTQFPKGTVAAEALYGRGRALQALGRKDAERAAWQALLVNYPHCPYVERAVRRLAELR
jgi:TolA-binding protein